MKKLKTLKFAVLIILLGMTACEKKGPATISGTIEGYNEASTVMLIADKKRDTISVTAEGKFTHTVDLSAPKEYILSVIEGQGGKMGPLYLLPGGKTELNIKLSEQIQTMPLYYGLDVTGDGAEETKYLYTLGLDFNNPFGWGFNLAAEKSFKEWDADIAEHYNTLLQELKKVNNKDFVKEQQVVLDYKRRELPFRYVWAKRALKQEACDSDPDFVAYAESIDLNDPVNSDRSKQNMGVLTDQYIRWYMFCNPDDSISNNIRYFDVIKEKISNQDVRNTVAKEKMGSELAMGNVDEIKAIYEKYITISTNENDKAEITESYKEIVKLALGSEAPDFEMTDIEGNTLKLSSLKGKVIYIDVWATWCGPCKQEAPFFAKLHEKFKNNDKIEFISISIDDNKASWEKYVAKEKTAYRQFLVANGFKSDLTTLYKISGIPRFMVIDKEGKIVTVNAPRPSEENTENFLRANMK